MAIFSCNVRCPTKNITQCTPCAGVLYALHIPISPERPGRPGPTGDILIVERNDPLNCGTHGFRIRFVKTVRSTIKWVTAKILTHLIVERNSFSAFQNDPLNSGTPCRYGVQPLSNTYRNRATFDGTTKSSNVSCWGD